MILQTIHSEHWDTGSWMWRPIRVLPVESGQLLQSQVQEVKEGRDGSPGEIP